METLQQKRIKELFSLGLKWDGKLYRHDTLNISVSHLDTSALNDAAWNILINEIKSLMKTDNQNPTFNFDDSEQEPKSKETPSGELTAQQIEDLPFVPDPQKDTEPVTKGKKPKKSTATLAQDVVVLDKPVYEEHQRRALNEILLAAKITVISNDEENTNARERAKILSNISKEINALRLATNKQWEKKIDDNNDAAKKITGPLNDHVNRIKELINKYEIAKEEARKAELARIEKEKKEKEEAERKERERIEKIKNSLKNARDTASAEISKDDYDSLLAIEQKISGWQPKADFYAEFMPDAIALKEELLSMVELKKPILEQIKKQKEEADRLDGIAKEQAKKELELQQEALRQQKKKEEQEKAELEMKRQQAEIEAKQELMVLIASMGISDVEKTIDSLVLKYGSAAEASKKREEVIEHFMAAQEIEKKQEQLISSKVKNRRTDFLFNIVDESIIPREFLKVDETKIRAAIQENRKTLEKDINGFKIAGVEIYQEKKTILN